MIKINSPFIMYALSENPEIWCRDKEVLLRLYPNAEIQMHIWNDDNDEPWVVKPEYEEEILAQINKETT